MEDYGYLLNKLDADVKKFSTTRHLNLKDVESRPTHYVFIIGCILLFFIIWYIG